MRDNESKIRTKMSKNFLAKFLYALFTYDIQTTAQDGMWLAAAPTTPNVHALSIEFEISRWSIGYAC
jgi:hypothetical protein